MQLTILVSYCSNERMFVDDLLTAACHVTDSVVVAVGRRLFDGRDEDTAHVAELAVQHPGVRFVWFDVPEELRATPIVLHNKARLAARDAVDKAVLGASWVVLLDGDEVPRDGGHPLLDWWTANEDRIHLKTDVAYKLANRWFFLHPRLVSEHTEDSIVMVHGSQLTDEALTHPRERDGVCMTLCGRGGSCIRGVHGSDDTPMFDHFSWVRESRAHLFAKVSNWGHTGERDWMALIERAWRDMEQGRLPDRDFVHGHRLLLLRDDLK